MDKSTLTQMLLLEYILEARVILNKINLTLRHFISLATKGRGSVLAFDAQVRGFTPGRSRRIFRVTKSSARLLSEGT